MNGEKPVLLYSERLPPADVVAAAAIAEVPLEARADPLAKQDYTLTLKFANGCASSTDSQHINFPIAGRRDTPVDTHARCNEEPLRSVLLLTQSLHNAVPYLLYKLAWQWAI
jgi:hypothetical protein